MWIRTQDKLGLTYNTDFRIGHLVEKDVKTGKTEEFWVISCVDDLGKYKSKERVLEVLDEIQSYLENNYLSINDMPQHNNGLIANGLTLFSNNKQTVYQMPKE